MREGAVTTVRRATESDVDAVRAVGFATWPATYGPIRSDAYVEAGLATWWSTERVRRGITEFTTYVAVDRTGDVVGCAVVGTADPVPTLWKLYVRPDSQGTGAGRALLSAVIAQLPPHAERVRLDHAEGNDRAHAFYAAHGFVETGRHGAGEHREVRMERRLR